mmetsp:Transcript_50088/g.160345  ORF Transcript_50088/g.160345 Transcript_50088/m.160345 type:complete len:243 (+) Transcript_50088:2096-2824(+)
MPRRVVAHLPHRRPRRDVERRHPRGLRRLHEDGPGVAPEERPGEQVQADDRKHDHDEDDDERHREERGDRSHERVEGAAGLRAPGDGAQGAQRPDHADGAEEAEVAARARYVQKNADEAAHHHHRVQDVPAVPQVGALVEVHPVHQQLHHHLHGEDAREDKVQDEEPGGRLFPRGVLRCEHDARYDDQEEQGALAHRVREVGVKPRPDAVVCGEDPAGLPPKHNAVVVFVVFFVDSYLHHRG